MDLNNCIIILEQPDQLVLPSRQKYRTIQLKELDMTQPPSADEDDADSGEKEINEPLDRIVNFLATYLP
ncbi:hypothetical protein SAMN05192561_105139 [Halopenitus malekzadehii]|uniref:Uncharacterized protein n=1 Tax=Halopenitus malekzadehii TaxID=1267564 RepID=A0A1H6IXE3_9EURY|nr:hypothetical protein [Halopenitus malekzadehii]SEH54078.1 hypothetical protein SAMN05192561_105139 [Halopenitus malekzadehii]